VENLGKKLRVKYSRFLPAAYNISLVKCKFALLKRTKISLIALLAGIFPDLVRNNPINLQNFN